MSMETDSPAISTNPTNKKHKEKNAEKREKKRKQRTSDAVGPSSPTKRQKNRDNSKSPTLRRIPRQRLASIEVSPFYQQTYSLYLPLAPIAQRHPIQGLCAEHLSPLILNYYPPFHGVVVSYTNPRCSSTPESPSQTDPRQKVYARAVNEYAASFVWLTADFLIFRPQKGDLIEGYINLQNESNVGLVCWNFFSASIERKRLPDDWRWTSGVLSNGTRKKKLKRGSPDSGTELDQQTQEEENQVVKVENAEGYFQDGDGSRIGGLIQFKVQSVDVSGSMYCENGFLSIQGSMLSEEKDEALRRKGGLELSTIRNRQLIVNGKGDPAVAGTLTNGSNGGMEIDNISATKHGAKR